MLWREYRFPATHDGIEPADLFGRSWSGTDAAAQQQRATLLAYGRLLQTIRDDPPEPIVLDGAVSVCGVGRVPVPVLIAVADLEDARLGYDQHPSDPGTTAALAQAEHALRQVLAAHAEATWLKDMVEAQPAAGAAMR